MVRPGGPQANEDENAVTSKELETELKKSSVFMQGYVTVAEKELGGRIEKLDKRLTNIEKKLKLISSFILKLA